jgi:GT2 family glycosyltransferase
MDKFSVVIPTIWKDNSIFELLNRYYNCNNVDEVILINNDKSNTPDFPKHKKLLYVEPNSNIFVNPAWNMGVRLAKNNSIIISNDDILYDVDMFTSVLFQLNDTVKKFEEVGLIGMDFENYSLKENKQEIDITGLKGNPGWACLFAFDKRRYVPIPETLKIYYGDDFLKIVCKPVFEFSGMKVETKMSVSANTQIDWVKQVTDNDTLEWMKIVNPTR